ncbi:MAG TPA: HAMP domain-containing sensor histidine kinase [Devosia sp.]|jgi:signal transduction histidine kinase|nr:HAMP domain-containing sensor histidine kinase [Devosia sp.]
MAAPRVPQKWRPTLAMIVFAVLLTVLALPAAIVVWFRTLDNTTSAMGPIEIGALLVALVITIGIGVVFSRTITGPIDALVQRTRDIARGGRGAIVAPDQQGTREIATLSQSFLDLAERLVDRTEYVSSFAAHVSHELKSPLTSIRGSAELLRDAEMSREERQRFLDHIIADSDRLSALLDSLRDLARADLDAEPGSATVAEALAGEPDVALSGDTAVPVALGPEAARAVFGQLLRNAREHGATAVTVTAERREGTLHVRVADNGRGVSPGNRDRIFEPFFTTRRETGGTGMGLQIVRSMLSAHGGSITLLPAETGAAFEVRIPVA